MRFFGSGSPWVASHFLSKDPKTWTVGPFLNGNNLVVVGFSELIHSEQLIWVSLPEWKLLRVWSCHVQILLILQFIFVDFDQKQLVIIKGPFCPSCLNVFEWFFSSAVVGFWYPKMICGMSPRSRGSISPQAAVKATLHISNKGKMKWLLEDVRLMSALLYQRCSRSDLPKKAAENTWLKTNEFGERLAVALCILVSSRVP